VSRLPAILTALAMLLAACGGGSSASSASVAARPIVISATNTPPSRSAFPSKPAVVSASPVASGNQVRIEDFGFTPLTISVAVGTQVTWMNAGPSNHTVTANDGSFDAGTIQRNASFNFTFSKAGTFVYHCTFHPTMQGTVIVS
jgi:plastocyanin